MNIEPTEQQLVDEFEEQIREMGDDEQKKRQDYRSVLRAWRDGRVSKKAAYVFIAFGAVVPETEKVIS